MQKLASYLLSWRNVSVGKNRPASWASATSGGRCDGIDISPWTRVRAALGVGGLEPRRRQRHELRLPGPDGVGAGLDIGQPGRCRHGVDTLPAAWQGPAVGAAIDKVVHVAGLADHRAGLVVDIVAIDELHDLGGQANRAHVLQAGRVGTLHADRHGLAVQAVVLDQLDDRVFNRWGPVPLPSAMAWALFQRGFLASGQTLIVRLVEAFLALAMAMISCILRTGYLPLSAVAR